MTAIATIVALAVLMWFYFKFWVKVNEEANQKRADVKLAGLLVGPNPADEDLGALAALNSKRQARVLDHIETLRKKQEESRLRAEEGRRILNRETPRERVDGGAGVR